MDRWEGEDVQSDNDTKENWDDPDPVEEEVIPVEPAPKKLTTKEKIALREAKEREKKEEKLRMSRKLTPEEELAKKLEEQKLQREGDLSLAMDAFGVTSPVPEINLDGQLSSKEDFDKLKTNLVNKLSTVSSPHYGTFLEDLFRELCVQLDTDDLKKISSSITALYNEKLKAQRNTNNKKKKNKGQSIKMEKNATNMYSHDYGDDYNDDLDDFM